MNKLLKNSNIRSLMLFNTRLNVITSHRQSSTSAKNQFEDDASTADKKNNKLPSSDFNETDFISNIPDAEEAVEREENFRQFVERSRDVSRFTKLKVKNKHLNQPPTTLTNNQLRSANYFRKLYSQFGKASGIDPAIAWPHKNELENIINDEKEYDLTLEQKVNILIERKTEAKEKYLKLVNETDQALKKMPKMVEQYFERIAKKQKIEKDRMAKKQELLDKAREYYGFDVDLKDPRYFNNDKLIVNDKKDKASEKKAAKK